MIGVLNKPPQKLDPRFNETVFIVEANDFEYETLYEQHHVKKGIHWSELRGGLLILVGHLVGYSICINVR